MFNIQFPNKISDSNLTTSDELNLLIQNNPNLFFFMREKEFKLIVMSISYN